MVGLSLLIVVISCGCTGSSGAVAPWSSTRLPTSIAPLDRLAVLAPRLAPGEQIPDVPPLLKGMREAGADESQISSLEDGIATFTDHEAAVARAMACVRAFGIDVVGGTPQPNQDGVNIVSYSYAESAPGLTKEQVMKAADDCQGRFEVVVTLVYSQQARVKASSSALNQKTAKLFDCLRENKADLNSVAINGAAEKADLPRLLQRADDLQRARGVDCRKQAGA